MQRRYFLTSLLSLAAVPGALATRGAIPACGAPSIAASQLALQLQMLHGQLVPLTPQTAAAHPAAEALALTTETLSRLQRQQHVSPGLLQNLADAIARTEQRLAIRLQAGITHLIALEISRLAG